MVLGQGHSQGIWDSVSAGDIDVSIHKAARRGGAEVAGWTLDWKIRVRFPAYPHRVWALWWQGGKRRLRTSRCPCRGRLGTLKTPSCPWRGCPAAGQNLETGHLSRHYIAEISLNVTLNHIQLNSTIHKAYNFLLLTLRWIYNHILPVNASLWTMCTALLIFPYAKVSLFLNGYPNVVFMVTLVYIISQEDIASNRNVGNDLSKFTKN